MLYNWEKELYVEILLNVKLDVALRSLISTITKTVVRKNSLITALEKEAFRLQGEVLKEHDGKKRELAQRAYNKVISRIEEIRNPSPLRLTRYE